MGGAAQAEETSWIPAHMDSNWRQTESEAGMQAELHCAFMLGSWQECSSDSRDSNINSSSGRQAAGIHVYAHIMAWQYRRNCKVHLGPALCQEAWELDGAVEVPHRRIGK